MTLSTYESLRKTSSKPSDYWREGLQQLINMGFENSSDVFQIQEEQTFGKLDWKDELTVRIGHVIGDKTTGEKLGDDYRNIIFKDITHTVSLGHRYQFNDNVWLCCFSDTYKYPTASVIVRRCNTTMNWILDNGAVHKEPCVKENKINYTTFNFEPSIILNDGEVGLTVQSNEYTNKLKINQRFLFGIENNVMAYKITSIDGSLSSKTFEDTPPLLYIKMVVDNISSDDDKVNRVANINQHNYTLSLNQSSFNGRINDTGTLTPIIKLNGEIVLVDVVWSSDKPTMATIDDTGTYKLLTEGIVNFKCAMKDNENIFAICTVNIEAIPVDSIDIIFDGIAKDANGIYTDEILQGQSKTYTVKKLVNNVDSGEILTITDISVNIPIGYYTFTNNGNNSFTIKNIKRYTGGKVVVNASDGVNSKILNLVLKGAY
jgi:hypothetical protein